MMIQNIAIFIGELQAIMLPEQNELQKLKDNESFRYIISASGIFAVFALLMSLFIIKHETPKFCIQNDDRDRAMEIIDIYSLNGDPDAICGKIEREMHRVKKTVTIGQAFCYDQDYRRSSWIAMGLVFFTFMQGWYIMTIDANQIFADVYEGRESLLTERQATFTFSAFTCAGSAFSLVVVSNLGRRQILVFGCAINAIFLILASLLDYMDQVNACTFMIYLFSFTYSSGVNACFMAHIAETNPDITLGFSFISAALSVMLLSVLAFPILNSLSSSGFFLFFAVWAIFAFTYNFFIIRESRGLTDKEKKKLYRPKKELTEDYMQQEEAIEKGTGIAFSVENLDESTGEKMKSQEKDET